LRAELVWPASKPAAEGRRRAGVVREAALGLAGLRV